MIGVVAPRPGERAAGGLALIAVDGKPPRPYRVGARLDRNLVLQSVAPRSAAIGPAEGATAVKLDLPPPQTAATGNLPPLPANEDPGLLQPRGGVPGAAGAPVMQPPGVPAAGARPPAVAAPEVYQVQPVQPAPATESPSEPASQRISPDIRR